MTSVCIYTCLTARKALPITVAFGIKLTARLILLYIATLYRGCQEEGWKLRNCNTVVYSNNYSTSVLCYAFCLVCQERSFDHLFFSLVPSLTPSAWSHYTQLHPICRVANSNKLAINFIINVSLMLITQEKRIPIICVWIPAFPVQSPHCSSKQGQERFSVSLRVVIRPRFAQR